MCTLKACIRVERACVCMCICARGGAHACTRVRACTCVYACALACTFVYLRVHLHTSTFMCVCMCMHVRTFGGACMHECVSVRVPSLLLHHLPPRSSVREKILRQKSSRS